MRSVDRMLQRFKRQVTEALETRPTNPSVEDFAEMMAGIVTETFQEYVELSDDMGKLRSKMREAESRERIRDLDNQVLLAREREKVAETKAAQHRGAVAIMEARLLVAQVDDALLRLDKGYPLGIEGVRQALERLERVEADYAFCHDLLARIADVVMPEDDLYKTAVQVDPKATLRAVAQVIMIIEEFDKHEQQQP
jgi:hypothetical protein